MSDPDRPEPEAMTLVVPFIVCTSKGGPYDDDSFVAGYQAGAVDRMLAIASAVGAERVAVGMNRGFPALEATEVTETPDYQAMPEWSFVTFSTGSRPLPEEETDRA